VRPTIPQAISGYGPTTWWTLPLPLSPRFLSPPARAMEATAISTKQTITTLFMSGPLSDATKAHSMPRSKTNRSVPEQSVGGDSGKAADGLTGAPQR